MAAVRRASFAFRPRSPYSFALTVHKPAGWEWSVPGEQWDAERGVLWSALRLSDGTLVGVKAWSRRDTVRVDAYASGGLNAGQRLELERRLRRSLGVDENLRAFYALGRRDALVRRLARDLRGMRVAFGMGVFERALLAVCLQMAPLERSQAMMASLIEHYGERIAFDGRSVVHWPSPRRLARVPEAELRRACRVGYRAKSIRRIAARFAAGFPSEEDLAALAPEAALAKIRELYGVGDYSAQIVSPHRGFPLDVWSARVFSEILFRKTPANPRAAIERIDRAARKRWGAWAWHAFVYALHDLPRLQKTHPITRLT